MLFSPTLNAFGPCCRYLSNFPSSPLIGDLGDYMTTIGKTRDDTRVQVRMPKIKDNQVPNQEVPSQLKTWGTPVCTISDPSLASRHVASE
ncbi:unnamed protein product [Prunus armeniaca]